MLLLKTVKFASSEKNWALVRNLYYLQIDPSFCHALLCFWAYFKHVVERLTYIEIINIERTFQLEGNVSYGMDDGLKKI